MAENTFKGLQTKSGASGYGRGYVPPPATLPTMYTAGNGNALTQYPTGGQVPYGLGQGQTLAPSASYLDRMKKFSNESFGTTYSPSASGAFDTTGMTADAAGNFYTNPADAIKMDANMVDMPGATDGAGMFDGVTAGGVMQGIDVGLKGWNAYNQYKGLGLAKDMFEREKAVTDANFINQQKLTNTNRDNSRAVGLALGGGAMTADQIAADTAAYNKTRFSEKGIGA